MLNFNASVPDSFHAAEREWRMVFFSGDVITYVLCHGCRHWHSTLRGFRYEDCNFKQA